MSAPATAGLGILADEAQGAPGPGRQAAQVKQPWSVSPDRCRAASAAAAVHPPVVPMIGEELFLSRNSVKTEAASI